MLSPSPGTQGSSQNSDSYRFFFKEIFHLLEVQKFLNFSLEIIKQPEKDMASY